jgi:hypothetical protein
MSRHRDVVVGQERDAVPHCRVVGEADHLRDELLAPVVGGMALAGDYDLHRSVRIEQQRPQSIRFAQHQREPLVGGYPAGEAHGQHVRVEHSRGPAQLRCGGTTLEPGSPDPPAHLVHQLGAQYAAQLPQQAVGS